MARPVRERAVGGEVELNVAEVDGVEVLLENVGFRHLVKAGQFDVPNGDGWVSFGLRKSDGADGTRGSVVMHPGICRNLKTKFNFRWSTTKLFTIIDGHNGKLEMRPGTKSEKSKMLG